MGDISPSDQSSLSVTTALSQMLSNTSLIHPLRSSEWNYQACQVFTFDRDVEALSMCRIQIYLGQGFPPGVPRG